MRFVKKHLPSFALLIAAIITLELISSFGLVRSSVLPAPSSVFNAFMNFRAEIGIHVVYTMSEVLIGFTIALFLGVATSVALFFSLPLKRAIYPFLVVSHIIPIIALAPLLVLWFGFGITPKIIVVVIYSYFPIAATLSDGLASTPQHLVEYGKSLGANRLQILRHINFPASMPQFFSGLKLAAIYSVSGAVVGEYVGAYKGLGILLQTSANSRATALMFAAIATIVGLTLLSVGVVILIERSVLAWRNYE
ncbi:ABC transporter permease [Candidatus Saccharibacteria bacterium]|jgi:ABC-type nitrate/sulfonate/bicarbonate transport system permease component|nr:ABC transporter permease [Candidatus Saccharibacteria bacterium]